MARLKIINNFKVSGPSITAEGCDINTTIEPAHSFPAVGFQPITPPCTVTLTPNHHESPDWGCKCERSGGCLDIPFKDGKWTINFETTVPVDDDDATVTVGEDQTC